MRQKRKKVRRDEAQEEQNEEDAVQRQSMPVEGSELNESTYSYFTERTDAGGENDMMASYMTPSVDDSLTPRQPSMSAAAATNADVQVMIDLESVTAGAPTSKTHSRSVSVLDVDTNALPIGTSEEQGSNDQAIELMRIAEAPATDRLKDAKVIQRINEMKAASETQSTSQTSAAATARTEQEDNPVVVEEDKLVVVEEEKKEEETAVAEAIQEEQPKPTEASAVVVKVDNQAESEANEVKPTTTTNDAVEQISESAPLRQATVKEVRQEKVTVEIVPKQAEVEVKQQVVPVYKEAGKPPLSPPQRKDRKTAVVLQVQQIDTSLTKKDEEEKSSDTQTKTTTTTTPPISVSKTATPQSPTQSEGLMDKLNALNEDKKQKVMYGGAVVVGLVVAAGAYFLFRRK